MNKALEYINNISRLTERVLTDEMPQIELAAKAVANALENGKNVFLFGTGHSHMLAEEMFYRAGGLVNIRPILEESLMLHNGAAKSTDIERLTGYAQILFDSYSLKSGDVLFVFSNSGRNGACVDMAQLAKENGLTLVALTNMRHTLQGASRHPSGKKLYEFADIVLDNMGCVGDACIAIDGLGRNVAATSTVIGAMLLNAVEARAVELMVLDGFEPEVFASSNVDNGDKINSAYIQKYRGVIPSL